MPRSCAGPGTWLLPGACDWGQQQGPEGSRMAKGEPKQPSNPAAALALGLLWARSSEAPGKKGEERSPAVTTGPAGAKDQGLDTESAGLAAYSDNRS